MNRILRLFKRIGTDVLAGRNVESYVLALIGVALIILDIFNLVDTEVTMTMIVAALTLLVFKTTDPPDRGVDLDAVLHNRDDFGKFNELVRGRRKVWIYGPSATNVLREAIEQEVLEKGGEVRVIVQDPASPAVAYLRDQLDTRDPRANLERDLESSVRLLRHIAASHPKFDCRMLPYSPGFSMVIVDPGSRDGQVIVEFLGFQYEHIKQRMHITITRAESQHWFEHWIEQYQRMWDSAYPLNGT